MELEIIDTKGLSSRMITVNPSDLIGDKKRELGQLDLMWKFNGEILKNDKTFQFYEIENGDRIISDRKCKGGNNP